MLFASFDFLLFVIPTLAAFWALRARPQARLWLVILCSSFFYAASAQPVDGPPPPSWHYLGLLWASTLLDFHCGRAIAGAAPLLRHSSPGVRDAAKRRRLLLLLLSLSGNLGLLGFFKYTNFAIAAAADISTGLGMAWTAPTLIVVLPIGISFYTFQSLSYTLDVWRQRIEPEDSFLRFAAFVMFFPQLVAGPIVRASEFLPQLRNRPKLAPGQLDASLMLIWKGLVKKVVLGDLIAVALVDPVFADPAGHSSLEVLIALYGFTLQIYADFSGYSDIAIGVAGCMGFRLPENFDRPYQSRHIGEFWQRWHMTLSTWLRDYVFFPLGGSRNGVWSTYFNLWLTMVLVGMWHGASWTFVIYANLQAAAMLVNRWRRVRSKIDDVGDQGAWLHGRVGPWLVACLIALPTFAVGHFALGLGVDTAGVLVGLLVACFGASLVSDRYFGPWTAPVQVIMTFHFTVLSRLFFRADDAASSTVLIRKLLDWDARGVRPGWFRWPGTAQVPDPEAMSDHVTTAWQLREMLPQVLIDHVSLILLVVGLGYHFTPRAWLERPLAWTFGRWPAVLIGLLFVATMWLISVALDGPRANIYFEF